jgi:hypothetical protein
MLVGINQSLGESPIVQNIVRVEEAAVFKVLQQFLLRMDKLVVLATEWQPLLKKTFV